MSKVIIKLILLIVLLTIPCRGDAAQVLHLVTSLDPLEAGEYIKSFENDTGIKVEWIRLSAGEVVARLLAEGNKPSQSIWFGGPLSEFASAENMGLLFPYRPKGAGEIPAKWRGKDNGYIGIYFGAIAFITNKNWLKATGKESPTSWQDLLSDDLRDNVSVAYPYTAGTGYTILASLIELMGEDGAFEYWKKFDRNIHHYTKSGSSPIIEVGLGETRVGVVFAQDAVRKGIARGFPIVLTYPIEGVPFEVGGAAIIKNGHDTETAKKFMDWIVSLPAQNLFYKFGRTPIHPRAKLPPDIKDRTELNLIEADMMKMGEKKSYYIERWRTELLQ